MGGGDSKKASASLINEATSKSRDDYTRYQNLFEGDRATSWNTALQSRNAMNTPLNDMAGRDYNSFNNPDVATARAGLNEFATTGGLSDANKQGIRRQATGFIPGAYSRLGQEADRSSVLQGGYGPGREALKARLLRDKAGAFSDANIGAENMIADQVRQGRQYGISGLGEMGRQTADRNLQRDATTISARQNLLDSDRTQAEQAAQRTLANRGMYYDTQLGGSGVYSGQKGGRDWLGTAINIGGAAAGAYGQYKANQ